MQMRGFFSGFAPSGELALSSISFLFLSYFLRVVMYLGSAKAGDFVHSYPGFLFLFRSSPHFFRFLSFGSASGGVKTFGLFSFCGGLDFYSCSFPVPLLFAWRLGRETVCLFFFFSLPLIAGS